MSTFSQDCQDILPLNDFKSAGIVVRPHPSYPVITKRMVSPESHSCGGPSAVSGGSGPQSLPELKKARRAAAERDRYWK